MIRTRWQWRAAAFISPYEERSMQAIKTFDSPYIHAVQLKHFLACDVFPLLVVLCAPMYYRHIISGWFDIGLCVLMWLVTGLGITVGYHRLFTHRSFECAVSLKAALAIAGAMAAQGGG